MSKMDGGSSLSWLSASTMTYLYHFDATSEPEPQNSLVLWGKLLQAVTKDVNVAWRMYLPIEFEDLADEENEQVFNANQSEDEMS